MGEILQIKYLIKGYFSRIYKELSKCNPLKKKKKRKKAKNSIEISG